MPGTIQVSILGLVGLPSSLQSSSVSIKVSVGKQTHETKDRGDFSFPLASLRDNLNVWIHDSQGNDIANTVVETRSIVEKGIWDDMFALKGGGHVHMRLHFNLSEHELNRIRSMRESATRKKQEDILKRSHSSSDLAVASGGSPVSSQGPNQAQERAISLPNKQTVKTSAASDAELLSKTHNYQKKQALPTSMSAGALDKLPFKRHMKEVANSQHQESQSPLDRGPSNVRKMILAFETSPVKEEVPATGKTREAPQINSSARMEVPSKAPRLKKTVAVNVNPVLSHLESVPAAPSIPEGIYEGRGKIRDFHETLGQKTEQLKELRVQNIDQMSTKDNLSKMEPVLSNLETAPVQSVAEGTDRETGENREFKDSFQENLGQNIHLNEPDREQHKEEKSSSKESCRSLTFERTKLCWNTIAREFPSRKRVATELVTEPKWRSKQWKSSQHGVKYKDSHWNEHFSNRFRSWIFLDETICSCIPNDGRPLVDVHEGYHCNPETNQGKLADPDVGTIEDSNESGRLKKSDSVSPPNKGAPKRPTGQAIKIAIMVGFGLLVFFTRQRK